ncbi:HET-domain-containing protein [Penicillium cosmopolitanum]|uniref:HET-domain-containing protein n=1 Tax=Penicillium cosmopolitanum TaxID=1131564 RepID=A0A9X0B8S2_9EURO|nr:HET-domain-containing protein [Penicillium cosmopolitanum]KAJ5392288.1 HET-domain-containing protein [Penicillium cosmopolitanum]
MSGPDAKRKEGYKKIERCCEMAKAEGLDYAWVDTCCIDKTSSAELSEAINSMYYWYEQAAVCYAFLADVPTEKPFEKSRWFMVFFDENWTMLELTADRQKVVAESTGIPVDILLHEKDLDEFSIAQRMSWASGRQTSRIEDRAYSLMGLFGINMPLVYGEKEIAFIRLQQEIMKISNDHSIFAWRSKSSIDGFPTSPAAFANSHNIVQANPLGSLDDPFTVDNRGVHLYARFMGIGRKGLGMVILNCKEIYSAEYIAIFARDILFSIKRFERVWTDELERIDLANFESSERPFRDICLQVRRATRIRKRQGEHDVVISKDDIYTENSLRDIMRNNNSKQLSDAAAHGRHDLVWLLLTRSDVWADLRERHVDPTPLMLASGGGHESTMRLLIENGADTKGGAPGWIGVDDSTPLICASKNGHYSSVKLLLDYGAGIDFRSSGKTALEYAVEVRHVSIVRLLIRGDAEVSEPWERLGGGLFKWASREGYAIITEVLLDNNWDVDYKSGRFFRTPLFDAAGYGREQAVGLLLDRGADIEAKDSEGKTPLFLAAKHGHEHIVNLLLERGANINVKDETGQTPSTLAARFDQMTIAKLLEPKA